MKRNNTKVVVLVLILWNGLLFIQFSKNFRLLITSSVNSSQSNPFVSLSSFWVSITFQKDLSSLHASTVDTLRVLFSAIFCKQEERSGL